MQITSVSVPPGEGTPVMVEVNPCALHGKVEVLVIVICGGAPLGTPINKVFVPPGNGTPVMVDVKGCALHGIVVVRVVVT